MGDGGRDVVFVPADAEAEGTTERFSAFCARFNIQKAAHFLDLYFSKSDIDDFGRSQEVQRV